MDKTNKKKTKIVNVKQKLHHPVKPKKKSHLGEYFAELIIIILFLGSIAITVYKYLGKGKFIERTTSNPVSINTDGSVGFNIAKSNGTSDDGNSALEIYSQNNNVFDISSYSGSVYVDFKWKGVTTDNSILGDLTINDTNIFRLAEQTIPISGQEGGNIQFDNNDGGFGYNLDCYGRFKGSAIFQNISSGAIFNGGTSPGGCKDTSLIMQTLVLAESIPSGYLSKDVNIKQVNNFVVDKYIENKNGVSLKGNFNLITTPSGDGILLNSTNIVQFPMSGGTYTKTSGDTTSLNSIVLPIPLRDGDFINFLFVQGQSLSTGSGVNTAYLSFRCVSENPFYKNSLLRSINFQQAITTMSNSDQENLQYTDISVFIEKTDGSGGVNFGFFDIEEAAEGEYIKNMFLTNGKSNMIFLNVFAMNGYPSTNPSFNFNSDGTTLKFVARGGEWAVEGNSYSDSAFFTEKTM